MTKILIDRHHSTPRSFTGEDDHEANLSQVVRPQHETFHQFAGHNPPDFLLRKLTLSSVEWKENGKSLPLGFYRDTLSLLLSEDWRLLYKPESIRWKPHECEADTERFARAAIHLEHEMAQEQYLTADALNYLEHGKNLHPRIQSFQRSAHRFFGAENPLSVAASFMSNRNDDYEFLWSKSFSDEVRWIMSSILKRAKLERSSRRKKEKLLQIVGDYRDQVIRVMNGWEPQIADYENVIQQHADKQMFKMYLLKRSAQLSG